MATRNFYLRNANRYFVKETDECCIDESYEMDELSWLAEEHGFEICTNENWLNEIERKANDIRDYYATALHCYYECELRDQFDGVWKVGIVPLVRSGYYTGANLDFNISIRTEYGEDLYNEDALNGDVHDEVINDYLDYLRNYENEEPTEQDAMAIKDALAKLIEEAIGKFYEFAEATGWDEYISGGTFSNGEGVYINKTKLAEKALKH